MDVKDTYTTIESSSSSEEYFFVNTRDKSLSEKYTDEVLYNGRRYSINKRNNKDKKKKEKQKCSCRIL